MCISKRKVEQESGGTTDNIVIQLDGHTKLTSEKHMMHTWTFVGVLLFRMWLIIPSSVLNSERSLSAEPGHLLNDPEFEDPSHQQVNWTFLCEKSLYCVYAS